MIIYLIISVNCYRLQMIDEDTSSDSEDASKGEPVLHIVDGINITPKEVLPQLIVDKM